MRNICQIKWLGQVKYKTAWQLQNDLATKRAANEIPDTLLLMEHPHTFTIGRDGHREHLLVDPEKLVRLDIAFHTVDRGGSVTYHGPGQLVGYPILNLREHGYTYHQYIAKLESVIIRVLSAFRVKAFRQPGQRGIWVLPGESGHYTFQWAQVDDYIAQIGAVGVKVNTNQITSHGFAINVDPSLEYFDLIMPCGILGRTTSLRHVLNKPIKTGTVVEPVIQSFCELFGLEPRPIDPLPLVVEEMALSRAGDFV